MQLNRVIRIEAISIEDDPFAWRKDHPESIIVNKVYCGKGNRHETVDLYEKLKKKLYLCQTHLYR